LKARREKNPETELYLNMELLSLKKLNKFKQKSREINLVKRRLLKNIKNLRNKFRNQISIVNQENDRIKEKCALVNDNVKSNLEDFFNFEYHSYC
jgi:hypothetical protein